MSPGQLLAELNEKQLQAVKSPRQPVLMIAGPGTGKTRTLIARITYEINHYKIPPEQILALTFSNKAAREIKSRLESALQSQAGKVNISTFHAFCLSVLRNNHVAAGLNKHFAVCDDAYQKKLLQNLIQDRVGDQLDNVIKGVQLAFGNFLLKERELPPFSAAVFDKYLKHLEKHKLIDYNLILTRTRDLFHENPDILDQYRFLYQSILIDEFQDTDRVQYRILKDLAWKKRNIFAVADDDQSIYTWRGANPGNIREFMKDFNISNVIFLEHNYRSGPHIVDVSQRILEFTDRIEPGKKIISDGSRSDRVRIQFFQEEEEEQRFILEKIKEWHDTANVPYSRIGIIYPRHIFGERLLNPLLRERIPYQLSSGRNLSEHPLMKKILLYLRLVRDPADSLILEDLLEAELGYHALKQIQSYQVGTKLNFRKALNEFASRSEVSSEFQRRLKTFIGNIANLVNLKSFYRFSGLLNEIIRSVGELDTSVLRHNERRLENLDLRPPAAATNPNVKKWIWHEDPKIAWLACKMSGLVLKHPASLLTPEKCNEISHSDLVIQLSPGLPDPCSARTEDLTALLNDKREGSLSVFFRWLQYCTKSSPGQIFCNYVVFDLETTDNDPARCGIVEIAAVRVRDGVLTDSFQTLVNPGVPITPEAEAVHHISNHEVESAPAIAEVWDDFASFVGSDLLLAHNGYAFDFRIIDRVARELGRPKISGTRFDSLILARQLFPEARNSIDALAERFRLDTGTRHRALDDVNVLHGIFQRLLFIIRSRERKTGREDLTEIVALGNFLEGNTKAIEDKIYFLAGIPRLLSPYSGVMKEYVSQFNPASLAEELLQKAASISGKSFVYGSDEAFLRNILEMAGEFDHLLIDEAVAEFLSFIALLNPQDSLESIEAVSLLTYHAAKGLEFNRVIIMGLEDENMPSFYAYKQEGDDDRPTRSKLEEQRRLLYVGITRAREEVFLTAVRNRFGRQQKSSPFLKEIRAGLEKEDLFFQGSVI